MNLYAWAPCKRKHAHFKYIKIIEKLFWTYSQSGYSKVDNISAMQTFIRQLQVDLDAFAHHDEHQVAVELSQVELPVCSVHHETTKHIGAQNTRDALLFADSICRAAKP